MKCKHCGRKIRRLKGEVEIWVHDWNFTTLCDLGRSTVAGPIEAST